MKARLGSYLAMAGEVGVASDDPPSANVRTRQDCLGRSCRWIVAKAVKGHECFAFILFGTPSLTQASLIRFAVQKNPRLSSKAFHFFVGVAGFEPATPCSQSRCANRTALHPEVECGFGCGPACRQAGVSVVWV